MCQLDLEREEKEATERERQLMERELEAERSRAQVLLLTAGIDLRVTCHQLCCLSSSTVSHANAFSGRCVVTQTVVNW